MKEFINLEFKSEEEFLNFTIERLQNEEYKFIVKTFADFEEESNVLLNTTEKELYEIIDKSRFKNSIQNLSLKNKIKLLKYKGSCLHYFSSEDKNNFELCYHSIYNQSITYSQAPSRRCC